MNYDAWRVFNYAYHPEAVYHMKFYDYDIDALGEPSREMFNILADITDNKISGNFAKAQVEKFADKHGDLIKIIINKNLSCGVTATTLNKALPGMIPQFKVQLAKEAPADKVQYPCLVQLKYDGVRLITIRDDDGVVFKTRNGKVVDLPVLAKHIESISAVNFILDGEIVYGPGKSTDRTGISGAINSAMHGGAVDETAMVYYVFDSMSKAQFESCLCNSPYSDRFIFARELAQAVESPMVQLAPTQSAMSHEGVQQLYEGALALGYEGLILKSESHKYTFKRSPDWVKLKEVKTADLTCFDYEEGEGKYRGMIGALKCKGIVEGKDIVVSVGSGLTDFDRSVPFREYSGQTIEIKYNMVIQDSRTLQWSLFLPRFVTVRIDK
jgi:DNA ligase-1